MTAPSRRPPPTLVPARRPGVAAPTGVPVPTAPVPAAGAESRTARTAPTARTRTVEETQP